MGTKALVEPNEGIFAGCLQVPPGPCLSGAACPLWKGTCLPADQPLLWRKCRVSSCLGLLPRLCLGVFTLSLSGQVWLGPWGWASPPALLLGEGPGKEVQAGCQVSGDGTQPLRLSCSRPARPGEAKGRGQGPGRPHPHPAGPTRFLSFEHQLQSSGRRRAGP